LLSVCNLVKKGLMIDTDLDLNNHLIHLKEHLI
jgi:hypothetical protein